MFPITWNKRRCLFHVTEDISDEVKAWMERMQRHEREVVRLDEAGYWAPEGFASWKPGESIRMLRWTARIPQSELAWRSGIQQGDISRIEHGRDSLHSTLARLIQAMECELVLRIRPKRPLADMRRENTRRRV